MAPLAQRYVVCMIFEQCVWRHRPSSLRAKDRVRCCGDMQGAAQASLCPAHKPLRAHTHATSSLFLLRRLPGAVDVQSRVTANGRVGATAAVYSAAILGTSPHTMLCQISDRACCRSGLRDAVLPV